MPYSPQKPRYSEEMGSGLSVLPVPKATALFWIDAEFYNFDWTGYGQRDWKTLLEYIISFSRRRFCSICFEGRLEDSSCRTWI